MRYLALLFTLCFALVACDEAATTSAPTTERFPPIATPQVEQPPAKQPPLPDAGVAGARRPQTTVRPTGLDTHGLPEEVRGVLAKIESNGPFRYHQDGTTFQNRERKLPAKDRTYYREYTVPTPGSKDRGARRLITGGDPPTDFYYTADHYRTFRKLEPRR